jgi:SlyX protein
MDERFSILETKVAYHEDNLAELNRVLFQQQRQLDAVQQQVKKLSEQLAELGIKADPTPHQKPPHY